VSISQALLDQFNGQINRELYSSYLYLSMAAYFEANNLRGFANWMKIQGDEERGHAMRFYEFVNERGGHVTLDKIDKPPASWDSTLAVFEATYKHEQAISAAINSMVDMAVGQKDYASQSFLMTFVDEQVEEEAQVAEIVNRLKLIGTSTGTLFWLDKEMGKRTASA
jgi:ferritin